MLITESCRITIPDSRYRCVITHKAGGDALWSLRCHPPDLMALSGVNERLFSVLLIVVHGYLLCGSLHFLMVIILPPRNHGVFFVCDLPFSVALVVTSRCVTTCHHHVTLMAKVRVNQYRNG